MDVQLIEALIPITAIVCTFGCPVALVFVFKWFNLRNRELQADAEARREMSGAVEARLQRLESVLLQIDSRQLMQGPPDLRTAERADEPLPLRRTERSG
ncbi:MAG TPA: hypothetical protein VH083_03105 [Myxococcales bacterium]|jgi:hypothetical protein|nr:hypothetical protein [Myxococcales bacterium]